MIGNAGFFWRVFGGTVAVILITAFGVYLAALPTIERDLEQEAERRVEQEAAWAAAFSEEAYDPVQGTFDTSDFPAIANSVRGSRFTLVAQNGRVLYDSHESQAAMDDHTSRAEIRRPGTAVTRFSRTLGKQMTYFALPVVVGGVLCGYSRVSVPVEDRELRLAGLRRAIQGGALMAALGSLLLAGFFARRVTQPLSDIAGLIDEIGTGQTTRRLAVSRPEEFARLARSVNRLADDLQRKTVHVERDRGEREAIFSALDAGLLAVDHEQRALFVNPHGREFLGNLVGDVKGKLVSELNRNSTLIDVVERCLVSGERSVGEAPMGNEEGGRIVALTAVPMPGLSGSPAGCVIELRDVSEIRRLEAVRRDFVSNVSHELKTPLTAMRGYTEAVLDDEDMPADVRRAFLEKAQRNTERLVAIVGDLLSLSRLESAEHGLNFEVLDLSELTRVVAGQLRDLADSRLVRLVLELPPGETPARVDEQAMSMALANLIANAVQYSPEHTEVRVLLREEDGELRLEVVDSGPGIPEYEQDRIFERFYRADKARARKLGGTGLGLSIVRHVMAAHGGRIDLDSEVGSGSRFSLCLPAVLPAVLPPGA